MSIDPVLTQLDLINFAAQDDDFVGALLPQIAMLFEAGEIVVKILPATNILDGLSLGLGTSAKTRRIIFYDQAEPALQNALRANKCPSEALDKWIEDIQLLLKFQRRARRSVLLVDRASVYRDPPAFIGQFFDHLKIPRPQNAVLDCPTPDDVCPERIFAAQTLAQSVIARRLVGELAASSLQLEVNSAANIDAIFQAYTEAKADQRVSTNCDLLLSQLDSVQQELVAYIQETGALKRSCASYQAQIQTLIETSSQVSQDRAAHVQKHHHAEARVKTIENDLQRTDSALQERNSSLGAAYQKISDLENRLREHEEERAAFVRSTSWRMTKPLRKIKSSLGKSTGEKE